MAGRAPETGGLDQELEPDLALEDLVVGRRLVADDRVGHVSVDVDGRRAGRPVARALLAADGAPGEGSARQPQQPSPLPGQRKRRVPPAQLVGDGLGGRVGEHREHEGLGVPERVAVVTRAGQSLRGHGSLLSPRGRLQDVEEGEADGLLQLGVSLEVDVGAAPEVVEVRALFREQAVPARQQGGGQRSLDLVPESRRGALFGPAVGQELDEAQALARLELGRDGHAPQVPVAVCRGLRAGWALHDVVHPGGETERAGGGGVDEHHPLVVVLEVLRLEGGGRRRTGARVSGGGRDRLVADQLGLDDHRGPAAQGLHLVQDRGHRPLREGDEAGGGDSHAAPGR